MQQHGNDRFVANRRARNSPYPILTPCRWNKDLSEDAAYLRAIFHSLNVSNLKKVTVLGCDKGAWNKVLVEEQRTDRIRCYMWWQEHERPALVYHNAKVDINTQDIATVVPYECHTLLCNIQPKDAERELTNLVQLSRWLAFNPQVFVIRVTFINDKNVLKALDGIKNKLGSGRLIGVVNEFNDNELLASYFVHGHSQRSLEDESRIIIAGHSFEKLLRGMRNRFGWEAPKRLPVDQLALLDFGKTLAQYDRLRPPRRNNNRRYMKELGYFPCYYRYRNEYFRSRILNKLVKPLMPLIKGDWRLTRSDPQTMEKTTREKLDHSPVEGSVYLDLLWLVYHALARYLRKKGCNIERVSDEELVKKVRRKSRMGWQDRELGCQNMGEYLDQPELWKPQVEAFRSNLLAGHPIKADFNLCGKREPKTENSSRMIWSLCATGRLYEAQVLSSVDKLLYAIPYTTFSNWTKPQDYGEIFNRMLGEGKHAICDDIKNWDTRISYSILCLEAAFLLKLCKDPELRNEIKHLYRLYAYPVVNKVEVFRDAEGRKRFKRVLYQFQGQVASGRRVTYSMNTITNIVINMTRAAYSQQIERNEIPAWVSKRLNEYHFTSEFTGKVAGDDIVIMLNTQHSRLLAGPRGTRLMNHLGMFRKKTGEGASKICTKLSEIEFCSRKFVKLDIDDGEEQRIVPIRPVEEIIMRKLFRADRVSHEYDAAWARETGRDLLNQFFFIPTIRKLAFALLSATPNNITYDEDQERGYYYTDTPRPTKTQVIHQINQRYFGRKTQYKLNFRAQSFDDLGYISDKDRETYDLDFRSPVYKRWEKNLPRLVEELRKPHESYDDWIAID